MFLAPMLAVAMVGAAPKVVPTGDADAPRRIFLEASLGIGRNIPPIGPDFPPHFEWGVALSGTLQDEHLFKATLGLQVEHAVAAWAGDGDVYGYVSSGPYAGTTPDSFQAHFIRISPQLRLGAENHQAFGYFGLTPGYALRIADLTCATGDCLRPRTRDHGINIGLSIGAIVWVVHGLGLGLEAGLDSAHFPAGHRQLAAWNQGVSGKATIGWLF